MKTLILLSFFFLNVNTLLSQFSKETILTDSSEIEIIRNSLYKITTEVYKEKDSIWYSVSYISDTNQVKTEGWSNKNNVSLGLWHEYRLDGVWLNSEEHQPYKLIYNDSLYPFMRYFEEIKSSADSIIQSTYGKQFFESNVEFHGGCSAYRNSNYLGRWSTPIKTKPNKFKFSYHINFHSNYALNQIIDINLDSIGNLVISNEDGFERIPWRVKRNKFAINREKMIAKMISKSQIITDSTEIYEYTQWYSSRKSKKFNGNYRYNLAIKTAVLEEKEIHNGKEYIIREFEYKVYSFKVWNSKLKDVFTILTSSDGSAAYYPASQRWVLIEH
jgi:hypothetical protein